MRCYAVFQNSRFYYNPAMSSVLFRLLDALDLPQKPKQLGLEQAKQASRSRANNNNSDCSDRPTSVFLEHPPTSVFFWNTPCFQKNGSRGDRFCPHLPQPVKPTKEKHIRPIPLHCLSLLRRHTVEVLLVFLFSLPILGKQTFLKETGQNNRKHGQVYNHKHRERKSLVTSARIGSGG